jgi:hypothetical protein
MTTGHSSSRRLEIHHWQSANQHQATQTPPNAPQGVDARSDSDLPQLSAPRSVRRAVLLELTTGIRSGRVCGPSWAVDLQAGEIAVHDNRVVVGGYARDKEGGKTKTPTRRSWCGVNCFNPSIAHQCLCKSKAVF